MAFFRYEQLGDHLPFEKMQPTTSFIYMFDKLSLFVYKSVCVCVCFVCLFACSLYNLKILTDQHEKWQTDKDCQKTNLH